MTGPDSQQAGAAGPIVVVCPTSRGGHIEHAFDLAVAGYRRTRQRSILLTRRGAHEYLPQRAGDFVDIREVLPPLPKRRGPASLLWYFLNLVREHAVIMRVVRAVRPSTVLFEEPRYPFPSVLGRTRGTRLVLVLHNVVEHDGLRSSNPVVDWIRLRSVRKFPSVLVHGRAQQRLLATQVGRVAAWSDLPADSYAEWLWRQEKSGDRVTRVGPPAFLCLGEIRANKGIETAIGAARLAGVRLSVRGKGVDETYLAELRRLAANSEDISIVDSFMSPVEFSDEIDASLALVIPYTSFEAQSGPLAKGMARGKWILSSQLPSLMDQAKGYPSISFFGVGDEEALAGLMRSVVESGTTQGRPSRSGQDPAGSDGDAWDATIEAVLTNG